MFARFWQSFACSSFAKPGKHFLIETDDAAEEEGGADDSNDYGRVDYGRSYVDDWDLLVSCLLTS